MIQILRNGNFAAVAKDVLAIAPDPIVEVNPDTGVVFYDFKTVTGMGPSTLFDLASKSKLFVGIRGEEGNFSVAPKPNMRVRDVGGFTVADDPLDPRQIEIVYDVKGCTGYGAWVEGIVPDDKIPMPTHVILLHELRHAVHMLGGGFVWDDEAREAKAVADENEYRKERGLPLRGGHGGGCSKPVGFFESYKDAGGGGRGGGNRFVATAACGSELDPNVEFLRRFRDDVIRATRSGDRFWDRYWERYQRLSPTVVEMIERDPELRDLVRWSLVQPIVHYLELVLSFPDAPLEDVPEPWASWLGEQRAKLADWLGGIELPTEFDGMEPDAVVSELGFLLRYVLRTPRARDEYVERLREHGALPLSVDSPTHERLAERLEETPATAGRAEAILEKYEPSSVSFAYGGEHVFAKADLDIGEWLYTVTVRNNTTDTFTEIVVFYARTNETGVVYLSHREVPPGKVVVFNLGVCKLVRSYTVGFFLGEDLVAKFPETGELTAENASQLNPGDTLRCADSWVIE